MKMLVGFVCALLATGVCIAQKHKDNEPFPSEVVIGRDSFIDIGPPFDYYDLTFLHADGDKTDVEQVSLTPPSDTCYPKAEVKVVYLSLNESLASLLERTNPCTIPEKKLNAELKRRKKGLVFSGMNVTMQVQCSSRTRLIRADILDRDIFGDRSKTPQFTSWPQTLFEKLDKATGQGPWDKPLFPISEAEPAAAGQPQSAALQEIAEGKFDGIFGKNSDRPSELYRLSRVIPRHPVIELIKSDPVRPVVYVDPAYPPIARAAHVQGLVEFHLTIAQDGSPENVSVDSGPKMLWQAATDAVGKWKFSGEDSGKTVQGTIRFGLNCATEGK